MKDKLHVWESVYDGVIGEKIPQNCSDNIFRELQSDGIRVIIDLRHDYTSDRFAKRCEGYGIQYFWYPVHLDEKSIEYMTEYFLKFCELIQSERFYMMGQHRAYIALCVFWSFTKISGLYPLELSLSIKRNKRLMNKVVSILHAIVDFEENKSSGKDDINKEYIAERRKSIERFIALDSPETITISYMTLTLCHRNNIMAYDISVAGLGVLGYLYRSADECGGWSFDILQPPPKNGRASCFTDAQIKIATYLSKYLPLDPRFSTLPKSLRDCIFLYRDHNLI